jgi:Tol biopolymer transport system component
MRFACVLAVIGAGGLLGASPALGAFPGANGRLAFVSDRQGADFDIWAMDPDGSDLANLTRKSKADEFSPNWRADGRKIAFNSNRVTGANPEGDHEIFVMNADGSGKSQLTFNDLDDEDPAWSPSGTRIVFQRDFDPVLGQVDYELFTMNADGTGEERLMSSPGVLDWQANWSPDGARLVFLSDRDGQQEIYTMGADGSGPQRLTFNEALEFVPSWSPDGGKIVFAGDKDGDFEIYTLDLDAGTETPVTVNGAGEGYPAWSPDGTQIVFASDRGGDADLYTMDAGGSDPRNVTNNRAFDLHPDWQPIGGPADPPPAFSPWGTAINAELLPGTSPQLNTTSLDGCPMLSPDGRSLYMASNRPGGHGGLDIWVARRADTSDPFGAPENLPEPINSAADDFCPTPVRGGRLFFVSRRPTAQSCGMGDIYVTRHSPSHGWREPRHLACAPDGPNSPLDEQGPSYVEIGDGAQLYFSRSSVALPGDIFVSTRADGGSFGAATAVNELNSAGNDIQPNVRKDGREIVFSSNHPYPGALGGQDIYAAMRGSVDGPWSAPTNLGDAINTAAGETRPSLSWDARTLLFGRAPGPEGSSDILVSTR